MFTPDQEEAMTEFLHRHFVFTQALPGDSALEQSDHSRMIQDYRLGNELSDLWTAMGWEEPTAVTDFYGSMYELLRRALPHVQLSARRDNLYFFYVQGRYADGTHMHTSDLKDSREQRALVFARERKLRALLTE